MYYAGVGGGEYIVVIFSTVPWKALETLNLSCVFVPVVSRMDKLNDPTPQSVETTTFHDGEAPREVTLFAPTQDSSTLQSSRKELRDHSIEEILRRPVLVKTGGWNTLDAVGTILYSASTPLSIFAASVNAKAKASGFLTARFSTCFKVVVNGQKMQQGALMISYAPQASAARKVQLQTHPMTFTQRPRTMLDLSTDTDVTFKVPYISEYLGYNAAKQTGSGGFFDLWVYSPLVTPTGPTFVDYTVFMWFEDIDLEYPTYVAQAADDGPDYVWNEGEKKRRLENQEKKIELSDHYIAQTYAPFERTGGSQRRRPFLIQRSLIPYMERNKERIGKEYPSTRPLIYTNTKTSVFRTCELEEFLALCAQFYEQILQEMFHETCNEVENNQINRLQGGHIIYMTCGDMKRQIAQVHCPTCLRGDEEVHMSDEEETRHVTALMDSTETIFIAEAGGFQSTKNDPAGEEAKNPSIGLSAFVSPRIRTVASLIPTLASVAGLPTWAVATAKGVAQAFGFSKPIADHMLIKNMASPFPHLNHADAASTAVNFGFLTKNSVQHYPGFAGQDVDEMSFNYLSCIPSYYRTFNWGSSQGTMTSLLKIPIRPQEFQITIDNWTYHTPMSYISNCFDQWRGSFMLHLLFIRTIFHSGRIMVAWQPGATVSDPVPDYNYLYREIVDIREATSFTFNVPYVANTPYLRVGEVMGVVHIVVLNSLRAPDTVSQNIDVIVEACAGKDIEFAVPRKPLVTPISYSSVQIQALQAKIAETQIRDDEDVLYEADPVYQAEAGDSEWGVVAKTPPPELSLTVQKVYGNVDYATYLEILNELQLAWDDGPEAIHLAACVRILSVYVNLGKLNKGWGSMMIYDHESNSFTTEYTLWEWVSQYVLRFNKSIRQGVNDLSNKKPGQQKLVTKTNSPKRGKSKTPSPPRGVSVDSIEEMPIYEAQGMDDSCETGNSATITMAEDPVAPDILTFDVSNSAHCVGESVTSWRMFIKRMMPWKIVPVLTGGTWRFRAGMFHQATTTGNSLVSLPVGIDALNWVAPLFVYWRGSMRYSYYQTSNTNVNASVRMGLNLRDTQMGLNEFQTLQGSEANYTYNQVDNLAYAHQISAGGLEVQVPFYSKRATATVDVITPGNAPAFTENPDMVVSVRATSSSTAIMLRGAGDDFDLGFFLGCPITKPSVTIVPINDNVTW